MPYIYGFAIDIKAPPFDVKKYEYVIRRSFNPEMFLESVKVASLLPYTIFRTVKYPWLTENDIEEIRDFVKKYGNGRPHYLNPILKFLLHKKINDRFQPFPYMKKLQLKVSSFVV